MTARSELPGDAGPTQEELIDLTLAALHGAGAVPRAPAAPWDAFVRLSDRVHAAYRIPSTTFTPAMRRFLFALGWAVGPRTIVGVGTFVGYTFTWLLRDRTDPEAGPFFDLAIGVDVDGDSTRLAVENCTVLHHGDHLRFVAADGVTAVAGMSMAIDLLFLDLDDPVTGKAGYVDVLGAALSRLNPGALVVAHDACVPRFRADFDRFFDFIESTGRFLGPWTLALDASGIALARVRP